MNLLAHLHLGRHLQLDPTTAAGNLLADYVRGQTRGSFARGVRIHRQIDSFTDSHPEVVAARNLFDGANRRFAGILVDLAFDLCLSRQWDDYEPTTPLATFIESNLMAVHESRASIPEPALIAFTRMRDEGWLHCYGDIAGLGTTIRRIARRRTVARAIIGAESQIENLLPPLHARFKKFYPELRASMPRFNER